MLMKKIDQIFGFWASQSLKLSRNTCFRGFKSSLVVSSYVAKAERLALSKMSISTLCLSRDCIAYYKSFCLILLENLKNDSFNVFNF